jgi:hypothetical protein
MLKYYALLVFMALAAAETIRNNEDFLNTTTCMCTTVPCPVSGANYLTEGMLYAN